MPDLLPVIPKFALCLDQASFSVVPSACNSSLTTASTTECLNNHDARERPYLQGPRGTDDPFVLRIRLDEGGREGRHVDRVVDGLVRRTANYNFVKTLNQAR